MEEGLRAAKNQESREEGKVPSENGRLERAQRLLGFTTIQRTRLYRQKELEAEMITNIENTTKSVSDEKEKEAKEKKKKNIIRSAQKSDPGRFSELNA